MIALTLDRFGLYPERLVADTAYGSAETLARPVHEQGIEPHIPVIGKARRGGDALSRDDFVCDLRKDAYRCPESKGAPPLFTTVSHQTQRRRRGRHDALPREQDPLRCLPAEAALHAEGTRPSDHALDRRGRTGPGAIDRQDRRLSSSRYVQERRSRCCSRS